MPYVPHTDADIRRMLEVIGVEKIDDLFADLPADLRLDGGLDLPPGMSEEDVRRIMKDLSSANAGQEDLVSFLGGGVYDVVIPAAVNALSCRSEFMTAYTPYQAEVSQGTLQAIYEWQTFVCRLTGLDVANASMYDGATALCEAIRLSTAAKRRPKVILPETLNPRYRRVVATVLRGEGVEMVTAPATSDGVTDVARLAELADKSVGAVVLANPNYLGQIEPVDDLAAAAGGSGAVLIACVNPASLSLLKTPAEYGADLAVGEAQSFGIPCSGGGPLLGFMACTTKLMRRLPGRVVGRTVDTQGRTGYVLTLQTREQHIRREKATSNICSNQGLNALRATIYLAMLGGEGLKELGQANRIRTEAFIDMIRAVPGVELPFVGPVFNETVIRLPGAARDFRAFARRRGLLAGIELDGFAGCTDGDLLVALTEKRTASEIAWYGELLCEYLGEKIGDDDDREVSP